MTVSARREFGEGPLSRVTAFVYTMLTVEALLLLTTAPAYALLLLLDRDVSNLPLAALCALPIGPAVAAGLYAVHHRRDTLAELRPASAYWRGYRANIVGVLRLWTPLLAWLAVVGVIVTHREAAGVPVWWAVLLLVVAAVAIAWGLNALVITSLFAFRARDVARLSAYHLIKSWRGALAQVSLLVLALGVTVFFSEAVLALAASLFVLGLVRASRAMTDEIRAEFVR
ncbi:MAG: hypothetical protein HOU81_05920 [Hamadaea sp.]|uniref:hypothetical protein n=1 Tax=Hamadaea sp. TaxID=2024425 RepID=UPI001820D3B7|nr:hypothetical protein [Hamadaea sp.]NUR70336.1 hypothetical protein [Hamadaea sp.]NUT21942.1 hypothetical protein [Hamadaea sp.]